MTWAFMIQTKFFKKTQKGVPAVNQDYQMTEMCHELNITLNSNLDFNYIGRDFMVNSGLDFDGVQPEILFSKDRIALRKVVVIKISQTNTYHAYYFAAVLPITICKPQSTHYQCEPKISIFTQTTVYTHTHEHTFSVMTHIATHPLQRMVSPVV